MRGRRLAGFVGVMVLALAACQSQPLPPAVPTSPMASGDRVVTVSQTPGATIRLAIVPPASMTTQASPKMYSEVDHLTAKLRRKDDDSLVADAGSIMPTGQTTTHVTFSNVTTGSTYYLELDAFDINGISIAKVSPTKSNDIVVSTATTYTPTVNLPLQDGTVAALNFVFSGPGYFQGAAKYLVWITNAAGNVTTSHKATSASPTLTGLADGNYTAWAAAVDDANGYMTPVKQLGAVTVSSGAITVPAGATFGTVGTPVSFGSTLTQWATNGAWNLVGLGVDAGGAVYAAETNAAQVFKMTAAGGGQTTVVGGSAGNAADDGSASGVGPAITLSAGNNPSGLYVDGSGHIYVGDTANVKLRMVPGTTLPGGSFGFTPLTLGQIYTIGTTGAGPAGIGFESGGTIYWTDGTKVVKRKPNGLAEDLTALPTGAQLRSVTLDRRANVYAAQPTRVYMYVAVPGTYFGAAQAGGSWVELTALQSATALAYRQIAVNAVGTLFIADRPNQTIWGLDSITGTKYKVIGTGASGVVPLADGGSPIAGNATGTVGLATSASGEVFFTTTGAIWKFAP